MIVLQIIVSLLWIVASGACGYVYGGKLIPYGVTLIQNHKPNTENSNWGAVPLYYFCCYLMLAVAVILCFALQMAIGHVILQAVGIK